MARSYRTRSGAGEADLVVVGPVAGFRRGRQTEEYGQPAQAVDKEKRGRIRIAARDYARRANLDFNLARFDIVSILLPRVRFARLRDAYSPYSVNPRSQGRE